MSLRSLVQETVVFQFRLRFRWSRQKAVDFMVENTAMSLHNVNAEINRYIIWPGQVCLNSISACVSFTTCTAFPSCWHSLLCRLVHTKLVKSRLKNFERKRNRNLVCPGIFRIRSPNELPFDFFPLPFFPPGEKFDLKDYHHVFLSAGPMGLDTLEEAVDKYIESTLAIWKLEDSNSWWIALEL